jgi:hypothetical protein
MEVKVGNKVLSANMQELKSSSTAKQYTIVKQATSLQL